MSVSAPSPSAPPVLKCLLRLLLQGLRNPIGTWLKTLTFPGTSPNSNLSSRVGGPKTPPGSNGPVAPQCESRNNPGPPTRPLLATPVNLPLSSRTPRSNGPFILLVNNGAANTPDL